MGREMDEQHVYHHSADSGPRVMVKVERNSRGYNWESAVSGAETVEAAVKLLTEAEAELRKLYGEPVA